MRPPSGFISAFAPLAFIALAFASLALQSIALDGVEPDGAPEDLARTLDAHRTLAGGFVATATLAGLALLAFTESLARAVPALSRIARVAGALWAMMWLAAASFAYAAMDLAGHFAHPAGAKTTMYASYAFITSPAGVALAGVLVLGVAHGSHGVAAWPRWYSRFSLVCGALTLVGGATLALSFMGMLGLMALPLWLAVTAVTLPLAARQLTSS